MLYALYISSQLFSLFIILCETRYDQPNYFWYYRPEIIYIHFNFHLPYDDGIMSYLSVFFNMNDVFFPLFHNVYLNKHSFNILVLDEFYLDLYTFYFIYMQTIIV